MHEVERVSSPVKEGRFQGGKGGQGNKTSIGEEGKSISGQVDAKVVQVDLESLDFTPSLAKREMGKKVGR